MDQVFSWISEQTDSCSSTSLSVDLNRKPSTTINVTPTKPTVAHSPLVTKEHRSSTSAKGPTNNGSLRESLDELNRLSNRVDNTVDQEHNRYEKNSSLFCSISSDLISLDWRKQMSRSVSLKPPLNHLPPLDDAEQITMDIESYRQVMKDVMVVKTVLHQLDRLLKHSDGANMTVSSSCSLRTCRRRYSSSSLIGFHDWFISWISWFNGHFSTLLSQWRWQSSLFDRWKLFLRRSTQGTYCILRFSSDRLVFSSQEIIALRKEKEQDKQTIKLLQEQMVGELVFFSLMFDSHLSFSLQYKYSSHTNGSSWVFRNRWIIFPSSFHLPADDMLSLLPFLSLYSFC